MNKKTVLVVATSRNTRGGISAVVNAHAKSEFWKNWHCRWIPTHSDKSRLLSLYYFVSGLFRLFWYLPSAKIVHIHLSHPVSFIRKCFFFFPAYLARKIIIIHFHAASPEVTIHGWLAPLYVFVFKRAHRVIAISESWEKMIRDRVQEVSLSLVYNPSTKNTELVDKMSESRGRYILFAGTLIPRKGYTDLIQAFSRIVKKHPDWKLVIAGNGDIQRGQRLAQSLKIQEAVEFPGWISGEKKDALFGQASIFCLPSYAEGFPMAIVDAIAYGIPVVTTPVGGITDALHNNTEILTFTPGNIEELENVLGKLIADANLRDELSKNASRTLKSRFDIGDVSRKIDAIYQSFV
ncbi:glycosyltransferase family 4 protein [Pollutibacter soli]|uniref:glycosyltransferase family 4 protein n=1 Tax=Pollutibacter soli TaxID=3034157 RepID=UPI0030135B75